MISSNPVPSFKLDLITLILGFNFNASLTILSASAPTASAKSTLLMTTASEVWKMIGCFSTVSSP